MDTFGSDDALRRLEGLRRQTRAHVSAFWFPLLVFGGGMVAAGGGGLLTDGSMLGDFEMAVCVAGMPPVAIWFRRRGVRIGMRRRRWHYLSLATAITAGCAVIDSLVRTRPEDAAPWLVVSVGYLVFAWWERSVPVIAISLSVALVALMAMARLPYWPAGALTMLEGGVVLIGGCVLRLATPREGTAAR
jgi:hypothetical protein